MHRHTFCDRLNNDVERFETLVSTVEASSKPSTGLAKLSIDILLDILDLIPDMHSLRNAVLSCDMFYITFQYHSDLIATKTLRKEIPFALHKYAIMTQLAVGAQLTLGTSSESMQACIRQAMEHRDGVDSVRLTPSAALSASRTYASVTNIGKELIEYDVSIGRILLPEDEFLLLNEDSPSHETRDRLTRTLYLWQIIVALSNKLLFSPIYQQDPGRQTEALLSSVCAELMAPWEVFQVVTVHAFLKRAITSIGGLLIPPHADLCMINEANE